jgi:hypothetical protein
MNGLYSDGSAEGVSVWLHARVQNALKYVNRVRVVKMSLGRLVARSADCPQKVFTYTS